MTLANGHLSIPNFQVSDISTIGLVLPRTPCPIGMPEQRSKCRIDGFLTPDCGSFQGILRDFGWKLFRKVAKMFL